MQDLRDLNEEELKRFEEEVLKLNIEDVIKNSHSIDEWKEISKKNRLDYEKKKTVPAKARRKL